MLIAVSTSEGPSRAYVSFGIEEISSRIIKQPLADRAVHVLHAKVCDIYFAYLNNRCWEQLDRLIDRICNMSALSSIEDPKRSASVPDRFLLSCRKTRSCK